MENVKTFCAMEKDGKVLLVKDIVGYGWKFPGGHVQDGEAEKTAAKREVLEETGFNVEIGEVFHLEDYFHEVRHGERNLIYFYRAEIIGGKENIQQDEIADLKWFTKQEALQLKPEEIDRRQRRAFAEYFGQ
jgi:8-oxo-dGTP diphosphatase